VIFEDDYDSEFRFCGPPLAALKSLDSIDRRLRGDVQQAPFPGNQACLSRLAGEADRSVCCRLVADSEAHAHMEPGNFERLHRRGTLFPTSPPHAAALF